MEKFIIEGGTPLSGRIEAAGNKNAALPLIACALLTEEEVTLTNVPQIRDVETMLELLHEIGVSITRIDGHTVTICAKNVDSTVVDPAIASRIRGSFLAAGPLLARFGSATLPAPGGDVIGRRRLDPHLDAFRDLGAESILEDGVVTVKAPNGLTATEFYLDEPSVMGTENALMAAALTPGLTVIRNAASEPHVQNVARMLTDMGAEISGIGSNVMEVQGRERLTGCTHAVCPDHIEIASFMTLAGVTGGELWVDNVNPSDLRMIRIVLRKLGLRSEIHDNSVFVPGNQALVMETDAGGYQIKVEDGPWPAFPADLTSIAIALATQSHGTALIFEKMFENRLIFTDKLVTMGANVILCDPHRAVITGPTQLRGHVLESPDIRAGMAMLIAALCATGRSEINRIVQIDRGYEKIDERLSALGARIERVKLESRKVPTVEQVPTFA